MITFLTGYGIESKTLSDKLTLEQVKFLCKSFWYLRLTESLVNSMLSIYVIVLYVKFYVSVLNVLPMLRTRLVAVVLVRL